MGSGNSKTVAKSSPSKPKSASSPSKPKSETNNKEVQKEKVNSEALQKVETQKKPESDSKDNVKINSHEEKQEKTQSHVSVNKTPAKNTPPAEFKDSESSSDEDEDDIAAVLAARRQAKEEEERNKRNMRKPETEEYPETYAQKLQREQYLQTSLLRQKTFLKNPDEWEADENEVPDFDVSKFKAVNQQQLQKQDIYGNPELRQQPASDPDSYYSQPTTEHRKAIPRYDSNDEELMADIEKEFQL
ncbi:hypothetical protein ACJMK2_002190 [Sinanodonta woodiana]|uniref:Uncharacterized protein n=1 Tax=Sinanodonta woodiana TaxID=1069815 RepID=A0ABD3XXZ5_SINWO